MTKTMCRSDGITSKSKNVSNDKRISHNNVNNNDETSNAGVGNTTTSSSSQDVIMTGIQQEQNQSTLSESTLIIRQRRRRKKNESEESFQVRQQHEQQQIHQLESQSTVVTVISQKAISNDKKTVVSSRAYQKHGADKPSGGIEALVPSAIGVVILICSIMAKMGFRGRASVAGIDLGTTNSVICVQSPAKGIGIIDCLVDPQTNSPIIPSVVSFLDPIEWKVGPSSKVSSLLQPHPSTVIVGTAAKNRIDTHPLSTLYHAKRILGRSSTDPAIQILQNEVEFAIHTTTDDDDDDDSSDDVYFTVPNTKDSSSSSSTKISPAQVGGYVVNYLKSIMDIALGHENVRSAVICVPAKFNSKQRQETVKAFTLAGIKVVRIVDEPTSAALAYGLHKKQNVDYILVYDFGGGTLDVSLLYVSDGFVDVMGTDGDDNLGGTDFDIAIAQYLQQKSKNYYSNNGHDVIDTVTTTLQKLSTTSTNAVIDEDVIQKCYSSKTFHHNQQQRRIGTDNSTMSIPLCTVSSFHTIGEQLKIQLSEKLDSNNNNNNNKNKSNETNTNNDGTSDANIVASAQCYGLSSSSNDNGNGNNNSIIEQIETFDDFCSHLIPITLSITGNEFNSITTKLFERSILPVQRLIDELNIAKTDIDEIVMVGGTTRMPQIRTIVHDYMDHIQQLNTHIDPDLTVAYGAASVID